VTHDGPVLLLDVGAVILLPGAARVSDRRSRQ
jgi:hypothetical protein